MRAKQSKELAVLVINYNGLTNLGDTLLKSIKSLLNSAAEAGGVDLWFIDNASTDGSVEAVKHMFGDSLRYVVLKRNVGYGGAFNLACRYILRSGLRYRYYACSNNDVVVRRDALKEVLRWARILERAFPKGFIVTPILTNGHDGELDGGCYYADISAKTWPLKLVTKSPAKLMKLLAGKPLPVSYADGAFIVFHHALVEGTPFNPKYFLYYEDVEASLRAWSSGAPSFLIPVLLGKHYRSSSTDKVKPLQTYVQVRNRVYTAYRYMGGEGLMAVAAWYLRTLLKETALNVINKVRGDGGEAGKLRLITRALIDALRWVSTERRNEWRNTYGIPTLTVPLLKAVSKKAALRIVQDRVKNVLTHHAVTLMSVARQANRGISNALALKGH